MIACVSFFEAAIFVELRIGKLALRRSVRNRQRSFTLRELIVISPRSKIGRCNCVRAITVGTEQRQPEPTRAGSGYIRCSERTFPSTAEAKQSFLQVSHRRWLPTIRKS